MLESTKDQHNGEEAENALLERFARVEKAEEPLVYEFTNDPALLHQYFQLREFMYRKFYHTDKFIGAADEFDKHSHTLVARQGRFCIGGSRLLIREAGENTQLPMESEDFDLRKLLPQFDLENTTHAEISRFAVHAMDEHLQREIIVGIVSRMIEKMQSMGVRYLFFKSTRSWARNLRMIAYGMGLKEHRVCTEIDVPAIAIHPDIKWVLTYLELPVRLDQAAEKRKEKELVVSM